MYFYERKEVKGLHRFSWELLSPAGY